MNNKQKIRLVVFDMAGTTVNEQNVVYKSLQTAVNKLGLSVTLDQVLLLGGGKEKLQALRDIIQATSPGLADLEEKSKAAFEDFLSILKEAYANLEVSTYEGTVELFGLLRKNGIKVALNTGYNSQTACALLKKLNWREGQTFDALVTADEVENSRPAPDMILLAMEKLEIEDPQEVVKVGDSIVDIEEGKAANCALSLGVTTGAQTAEQLETARPDHILDSLTELSAILSLQ